MMKTKSILIKILALVATLSLLFAVKVANPIGDYKAFADVPTLDGVTFSKTAYKVSKDGNYALLITAFSADDILADKDNAYIIGYEIGGEDALIDYGKKYYETVALSTGSGSVNYGAGDIFGETYEGYFLNIYEITDFDTDTDYTIRPFIKKITLVDDSYTVDSVAYGAEKTIDVKTVTFDMDGGDEVDTLYVQSGTKFGSMPTPKKSGETATEDLSRWSEDISGQTITEDKTISAIWKEVDITGQFTWGAEGSWAGKNGAVYINYKNSSATYGTVYGTTANLTYNTTSIDVSKYIGRVLRITLPDHGSYGLVFTPIKIGVGSSSGTQYKAGWYAYQNDGTGDGKTVDIVIPKHESYDTMYLKTTYYLDTTGKVPFSAKILDACIVTFDTQGGTAIPSQTVSYGEDAETPANPEKLGVTFDSWDKSLTGITSSFTATASYSAHADTQYDITDMFTWTNNYGIYLNYVNNKDAFGLANWSTTYKYSIIDVTAYQGRTLKITLPQSSGYGIAFSTGNDPDVCSTDYQKKSWYYVNSDGATYSYVSVPTVESGSVYAKVSYRRDGKISSTDETTTDFSAIILNDSVDENITDLFVSWTTGKGVYANYANSSTTFGGIYDSTNNSATMVDVTAFQGRTIRITLGKATSAGIIFATTGTLDSTAGTYNKAGWYYINTTGSITDGNGVVYVEITIPTITETEVASGNEYGRLYLKTFYNTANRANFYAIILGETD